MTEAHSGKMFPAGFITTADRDGSDGAWEGHAILDFLKENESDVKPDTIHADTQGQSNAIFGLAYLLGIQLMPRIRNWKAVNFYSFVLNSAKQTTIARFTPWRFSKIREIRTDTFRLADSP
jgi:TnpA family transposase